MRIEFLKMELITTARIDFGVKKKRYYADLLTIFREPFVASMAILCLGQKNRKINTLFKDKKHAEPEPIIGSCCWAITIEQIHVIVIVFVYLE